MSGISFTTDGFVVDAEIVGAAFDLLPADVPTKFRAGEITSRCETGVEEDAGRWRLTFYFDSRALRLVVDKEGSILSRTTFPSHAPAAGPIDLASMSAKT